jgi:hypothetical protein
MPSLENQRTSFLSNYTKYPFLRQYHRRHKLGKV